MYGTPPKKNYRSGKRMIPDLEIQTSPSFLSLSIIPATNWGDLPNNPESSTVNSFSLYEPSRRRSITFPRKYRLVSLNGMDVFFFPFLSAQGGWIFFYS